jgi:hypothetical protein
VEIIGKGNQKNLAKFGVFCCKTLDYIADPNFAEREIPSELFDIGHMLTKKLKNSNNIEFFRLLRYVNGLKYLEKYHIGLDVGGL